MITFVWQQDWQDLAHKLVNRLIATNHDVSTYMIGGYACADQAKPAKTPAQPVGVATQQAKTQANPAQHSDPASIEPLSAEAIVAKSLAEAMSESQTVITLLATTQEVEDLYLGEGGIFANAAPECMFIDLSTSNPKLSKEIYALAAVHDHRYVEAPIDGEVDFISTGKFSLLAAGEPDNLKRAKPLLEDLSDEVLEVGLPGSGQAMKLANQIALAGAMLGVVEAISFAKISGVEDAQILDMLTNSPYAAILTQVFGKDILAEDFYHGLDLSRFYADLEKALVAADEAGLALPGLETAHQLYDLLVMVGGAKFGIHGLALIYYDEEHCAKHGLNWALAQKAMDVYERGGEDDPDEYYFDDDDCDDPDCDHHHHHMHDEDEPPRMGNYFSSN